MECLERQPPPASAQEGAGLEALQAFSAGDVALRGVYLHIVDAGIAHSHFPIGIEGPVLITVGPEPLPIGAVLVLEGDSYFVVCVAEVVLLQGVIALVGPLAAQKVLDGLAALEELVPVAPDGVLGVRHGATLRVSAVPGILRRLHLLPRGFLCERGDNVGHTGDPSGVCTRTCNSARRSSRVVISTGTCRDRCISCGRAGTSVVSLRRVEAQLLKRSGFSIAMYPHVLGTSQPGEDFVRGSRGLRLLERDGKAQLHCDRPSSLLPQSRCCM
mmetsp:Transcript_1444/g.3717  ORF Transcript_1444/g.3717 Transcript_1444/m.3717 type:complete len:272 (-) Transcript_1444:14-829(-)